MVHLQCLPYAGVVESGMYVSVPLLLALRVVEEKTDGIARVYYKVSILGIQC